MQNIREKVLEAKKFICEKVKNEYEIGLLTGTGLSEAVSLMEAIAGVHAGMKILGPAAITNINNPDAPEKATVEEIIETAQKASVKVNTLVSGIVKTL